MLLNIDTIYCCRDHVASDINNDEKIPKVNDLPDTSRERKRDLYFSVPQVHITATWPAAYETVCGRR